MKPRAKSNKEVWEQAHRCNQLYNPFDITKKGTSWLAVVWKIANFYSNNIIKQVEIEYPGEPMERHEKEKFSYAVRSFQYDLSREEIRALRPYEKPGLYAYDDAGNKITPSTLYFGCDTRLFREDGQACGYCYYHYMYALRPVYLPDGTHYREPRFANVCARYKDGIVCDFYHE